LFSLFETEVRHVGLFYLLKEHGALFKNGKKIDEGYY